MNLFSRGSDGSTHHMGTPMISQIFLRGVYHVNCSRAPIEVREMLSCSPLMREARWDCSPSSTLCQNCLPETGFLPEFGLPHVSLANLIW